MRFVGGFEEGGFIVVAPEPSRYGAWMYWFDDTSVDTTPANPDIVQIDALIAFHGTADDAALFEGGLGQWLLDSELPSGVHWRDTPANQADAWRVMGRSVPERIAGIAMRNGCEPEPDAGVGH